ncbi:hypothetical protein KVP09_03815 [Alcaligenaceae bacterium CGII-47]|nr:hypothetical protein [Alcaligenaceae bacterium CGII-47]
MSKPAPKPKKGVVVVEPLNWVSPKMREEQGSKDRDTVASHDASSSDKEE